MSTLHLPPRVQTMPALLAELAEMHGSEVALRQKQYGLWNEVTYASYARHVRETALGLQTLGLQPGDRVALICENTPLWLYAQLGVQAAGGVSVGLYPSMTTREVADVLALSGATWAVVQGEEQVDKLLELQAVHPLKRVVYGSERGMRKHAANPLLISFEHLTQAGETHQHPLPTHSPDDLAHLTLTSGTTGPVRAVTVTHRQLLGVGQALLGVDPLRPGDDHLSFLPLAWSGEQLMSVSVALQSRLTVNFPESGETVMSDLAELGPQVMYTPPRLWEDLRAEILGRLGASYGFNRLVSRGLLRGAQNSAGADPEAAVKSGGNPVARAVLLRPLLDRMGLLRLRRAYVTGSSLNPELTRFFQSLGINLKSAYGQAESLGLSHVQRDRDVRPGQVGQPLPGAEAALDRSGGLVVRAPWVSAGYYGDPEATASAWREGWLHSGDAAELQHDGTLKVRGRLGDLCRTRGGESVEPQATENRLKLSPYLRDVLVLAEDQDSPSALLALDAAAVSRWAERQRLAYSTFADLSQRPEVAALIRAEVESANLALSPAQQVVRFAVLYKSLDADDGELTRTGTLRRSVVASHFAPLIEGLRSGAAQAHITAEIEYGNGQATRQPLTVVLHSLTPGSGTPPQAVAPVRSLA